MATPDQGSRPVSLDDLLQTNKAQFDRLFEDQMHQYGAIAASVRPVAEADLQSASLERAGEDAASDRATGDRATGDRATSDLGASDRGASDLAAPGRATFERSTSKRAGSERAEWNGTASVDAAPAAGGRAAPAAGGRAAPAAGGRAAPAAGQATPAVDGAGVDPITLDLIENALRNARHEMDAVLFRSAMSPVIREQHDEFPMITDARGRMIVGQFGSYVAEMLAAEALELFPGDVILQSDPYRCGGAISHINDWMVLVPIFFDGALVGFSSMFGHMMDVGGPVPGSMPTAATSIFGEGLRIPPIKLYERGELNKAALDIIMNNTRTPGMNYSDLMAIIAGSRAGERRVVEICERFGRERYLAACEALLARTNRAMRQLIVQNLPEEPQSFEDYVDDDGCGNGPFRMSLTVWREGEHAYFDWTGTSRQAPGPINFYLHEGMFKMFIGVYMIMVFDPQILFNDGFYDLIHVSMPKGSLVNPEFPAALGCRTHALARQFDVLGGALSRKAPEMATAAGYGSSPHFLYSGTDSNGTPFQLMEILYGGIPGRPVGDGMDGHSWWPLFENIPTEYLESYYPLVIEAYSSIADTGGPGRHRGGNGVEKIYRLLEPGEISIHDDRHLTHPWGILGGQPGGRSEKWLVRADGERVALPSKVDNVKVVPGDRIVFRTAGGGGWGDVLARDPEQVRRDVVRGLVSREAAAASYGVVLDGDVVDRHATDARRETLRRERKTLQVFDFGPLPETIAGVD